MTTAKTEAKASTKKNSANVDLINQVEAAYQDPRAQKISKAILNPVLPSPKKDEVHNTETRKKARGWTRYIVGGLTAVGVAAAIPAGVAAAGLTAPAWLPVAAGVAGVAAGVVAARAASRVVGHAHDFIVDHKDEIEAAAKDVVAKVTGEEEADKVVNKAKEQVENVAKQADKMKKEDVAKILDKGASTAITFMANRKKAGPVGLPKVEGEASVKIAKKAAAAPAA